MSDRPTPELAAFCATQSPGLRSMDSFSSRAAVGGLMLSMASWRGSASGSANRHDLQVVDAPSNGQHSPHPFISDDARQRRPVRIYSLDEIQVIHARTSSIAADIFALTRASLLVVRS